MQFNYFDHFLYHEIVLKKVISSLERIVCSKKTPIFRPPNVAFNIVIIKRNEIGRGRISRVRVIRVERKQKRDFDEVCCEQEREKERR